MQAALAELDAEKVATSNKCVANGVASLGADGMVPSAQLPAGSCDAAAVVGRKAYNPGTLATFSTTSTTAVHLDATNLAVTFTTPSSGVVLVRLNALTTGVPARSYYWHLREGTTTVAFKYVVNLCTLSAFDMSHLITVEVSGLAPASSHTYKWAHSLSGGATAAKIYAGGNAGAAIIRLKPSSARRST